MGSPQTTTLVDGSRYVTQSYYAYGRQRGGGTLPTDHRFTSQKLDVATGLYYYNARYYDPVVGFFLSPDTFVPDPTSVWDYNRFGYVRGNPLKYSDPSGHETSKPDWWPDLVPYIFDLPDGMTQAQFLEWLAENNIPTTWGVQAGGSTTTAFYVGGTGSAEVSYMFNWLSGEVMLTGNGSVGLYLGLPDIGGSLHVGLLFVTGASGIERSVLGLSRYTSAQVEVEALGAEIGVNGAWSRAVKNLGDDNTWVPGGNYIDPRLDRTVDALNLNLNAGVDILSVPFQAPEVPFDIAVSHGVSHTSRVFSFNLYTPFTAIWNWEFGD